MTKLFKNKVFKSIFVLLIIAILCAGTLSILNDLLYVSENDRTLRAIKKVYGEQKEPSEYVIDDSISVEEFGTIDAIYKIENENGTYDLLFKTTGKNGYKNGTITIWTQVIINNDSAKINKIIIEDYQKQTLMSKITAQYLDGFELSNYYGEENKHVVSGATKSSTAVCNAVNCVIKYVKGVLN